MIYSNMILESNTTFIHNNETLDKISEEFNNFSKIMSSISILQENTILTEGIDFKKIGQKIKNIWSRFVKWFKEHVIDKFKDFVAALKAKKALNNVKSLMRLTGIKKAKVSFRKNQNGQFEAIYISKMNESTYITEAGDKDSQLAAMVAKMIRPQVFFNINNYVDCSKYLSVLNKSTELTNKTVAMYKSMPDETDTDATEKWLDQLNELTDDIKSLIPETEESFKRGPLATLNDISYNGIKETINKDLESKMPTEISFNELIKIIEDNTKSSLDATAFFSSAITTVNKQTDIVSKAIEEVAYDYAENSGLAAKRLNCLNSLFASCKQVDSGLAALQDYCNNAYNTAALISESLLKLSEIL